MKTYILRDTQTVQRQARVQPPATAGEILVRPARPTNGPVLFLGLAASGVVRTIRRLDGAPPPVVASHTSTTRWAFRQRNCPDRSWCGTTTVPTHKATTPAGQTHANDSMEEPRKENNL